MPTSNDIGRGRLLEAAHRIQALFEMPMVTLNPIVQILRGPMLSIGQNYTQGRGIAFRLVCRDTLRPYTGLVDRVLEECLRRAGVPPLGKTGVHDLPVLIDCSVDIRSAPLQADRGLINPPFRTDGASVSPRSFAEEREKILNPSIGGTPVNDEATFGKPLHDISGAQAVANVPPDGQGDDIIWEGMM